MNKSIQFKGIVRNSPDSVSELGECAEIINLRPVDKGTWRVITPPTADFNVGSYTHITIHKSRTYTNYIGYDNTTGVIAHFNPNTGTTIQSLYTIPSIPSEIKFGSMDNFLVFLFDDNTGIHRTHRAFYSEDGGGDKAYKYYDKGIPKVPAIKFDQENKLEVLEELAGVFDTTLVFPDDTDIVESAIQGKLSKTLETWEKRGEFEGYVLFMYAYKLFDGNYVGHSIPQIVRVAQPVSDETRMSLRKVTKDKQHSIYIDNILAGKPNMKIIAGSYPNLDEYKDLILSVDIFMTRPLSVYTTEGLIYNDISGSDFTERVATYKHTQNNLTGDVTGSLLNGQWTIPNVSHVDGEQVLFDIHTITSEKLIDNRANYYKVKSINIDELSDYETITDLTVDITTLTTNERLGINDNTHHQINGGCTTTYNGSVFLGDIHTELFEGFSPTYFTGALNGTSKIAVELKTVDGIKMVESTTGGTDADWGYILGYPDSRATAMYIYDGGVTTKVPLKAHPLHNFAYFSYDYEGEMVKIINAVLLGGSTYPAKFNNILIEPSRVQASNFQNILHFPSKYSYNVGYGQVNHLSANSQPMHSSDYGNYPIYALTTKGVWTMQTGVDMLITKTVRTSEEVCVGKDTVYIDDGICFLTEESIVFLRGHEVTKIGDKLQSHSWNSIINDDNYGVFVNNAQTVEMMDVVTNEEFGFFLPNARIGYVPNKKEIYITNPTYNYSYIYNVEFQVWYKTDATYNYFITDFPNIYGEYDGVVYDLQLDAWQDQNVLLQTRPMELAENALSSIQKIVFDSRLLRMTSDPSIYMGVYLYGSNDYLNWRFLDGKQVNLQNFNNLYISEQHASYRYYIFIFAGKIGNYSSTNINLLDIDYEPKYNTKSR